MNQINGVWLQKKLLKNVPASVKLSGVEILRLLAFGAVIAVAHSTLRLGLGLPGHKGLLLMGILIGARTTSNYRWAGSIAGASAATFTFAPGFGFAEPLTPLLLFLIALALDIIFIFLPQKRRHQIVPLALASGAAFTVKPLIKFLLSIGGGIRFTSLMYGLPFPLASHILFGAIGGLIGAGLVLSGLPKIRQLFNDANDAP